MANNHKHDRDQPGIVSRENPQGRKDEDDPKQPGGYRGGETEGERRRNPGHVHGKDGAAATDPRKPVPD